MGENLRVLRFSLLHLSVQQLNMDQQQIIALQEEIAGLRSKITDVEASVSKNNFGSTQTFSKDCIFTSRLRVPVYSAAPTVAEVGDLICVSAELYICTSTGPVVFTLVGSQT